MSELSEEEIRKILINYTKHKKETMKETLIEAIEGLLDLYKQEKEKNEKLENEIIEKDLIIDGMKEDRRIAVEEIQEEYYISKDKIKEKIEWLDKLELLEEVDYSRIKFATDILKKLLKEEQ